jgi:hypothetical protein
MVEGDQFAASIPAFLILTALGFIVVALLGGMASVLAPLRSAP